MDSKTTDLPELNQRIQSLIEKLAGGNVAEFVRMTQISSHQVLNRIFNIDGRTGKFPAPSAAILSNIKINLPQVDYDWLLTGNGEMLKSDGENNDRYYTYLIPLAAQAGSLNDFSQAVELSDCEKIVSPINGVDWAITIYGDSMSPEYTSGSMVLIKKINSSIFIEWGKVYVLDTRNGTIIKKIMPTNDENIVQCISINESYPPFLVNLKDVFGMYRVLLCMSMK